MMVRRNKRLWAIGYAAMILLGIVVWSHYSATDVFCSCTQVMGCDCTDYVSEAAKTIGIMLIGIGTVLFILNLKKGSAIEQTSKRS